MSSKITKKIFDSKHEMHNISVRKLNEYSSGVKYFDIERKHVLYGRIDRKGDAIYVDNVANLAEIYTGSDNTEFAIDFVSEAFSDMRRYVQANTPASNTKSLYRKMRTYKAWRHGDLEWSYHKYMSDVYANFVNEYLQTNRRYEKINNFNDFVQHFLSYISRIVYYYPVTRTGYLLSHHCSPFVSGLMFEIASERHGVSYNKNVLKYFQNDDDYNFFVGTARKFGFMVDKNAPWRLVYNVASKVDYMQRYGAEFDNVFDLYYQKAHLTELDNFKNYMFSFYRIFYAQFNSYTKLKYETDQSGECTEVKVRQEQTFREALHLSAHLPKIDIPGYVNIFGSEYWLKIILKLRLLEAGVTHDKQTADNFMLHVIRRKRMFDTPDALNYINDLTKGMFKTKFNTQGKYWHGNSKSIYDKRKVQAQANIDTPAQVDEELTGVKNEK